MFSIGFLEVAPRKPEVKVTVSFGFMQLVKDLTILGQNSQRSSHISPSPNETQLRTTQMHVII